MDVERIPVPIRWLLMIVLTVLTYFVALRILQHVPFLPHS